MTDDTSANRPRAFKLDRTVQRAESPAMTRDETGRVHVEPMPDAFAQEAGEASLAPEEQAIEAAQRSGLIWHRWTWAGVFWTAAGAFVSLAIGIWFDSLIQAFFTRSVALGWIGVGLIGLLVVSALALIAREVMGVFRQRRIARLHMDFARARADDDRDAARLQLLQLLTLYGARPETARTRAYLESLTLEIIDGRDLIDIAERELIGPLDQNVRREIAQAAKRVSVVTAISPRATVDLIFVAGQAIYLIRRIAEIYGGRPGFIGFLRLARAIGTHLAITGGMVVGDSLVQQVVGHGIAARLSARLGEGVLNGMLTTRVGLSAMAVCRPMPFVTEPPPSVSEVAPFLFGDRGS